MLGFGFLFKKIMEEENSNDGSVNRPKIASCRGSFGSGGLGRRLPIVQIWLANQIYFCLTRQEIS